MKHIINTISNSLLFMGLSEDEINSIASIAVLKKIDKGELIFAENDKGNGFYIVAEGKVKIFKISFEGKEQILHIFGQGETFGEIPVFINRPFPAHAEAIQKSNIIFLPKKQFINLIKSNIKIILNMLGILSIRLHQFTNQVETLSFKKVHERLVGYFLFLSEEQQNQKIIHLNISKNQLANLIGTTPETLSRSFLKLDEMGLIQVDGSNIKICNFDRLKSIDKHQNI